MAVTVFYIYRPQRSCGKGYVFTRVCDSVNRCGGRSASVHAVIPPPYPSRHPPRADPPPPEADTPWEQAPPWSRHPPGADTPPRQQTPAYGQWAAGTHPTGMDSCHTCDLIFDLSPEVFVSKWKLGAMFVQRGSPSEQFTCVSVSGADVLTIWRLCGPGYMDETPKENRENVDELTRTACSRTSTKDTY